MRGKRPRERRDYKTGDRVEVLSSEEGFSDAWATAMIVGHSKGSFSVEYAKFVDVHGKLLREKVDGSQMRHVPLFPTTFNPSPGLRVEGYLHDCWWPGEVVEQHHRKGLRVHFDDGDSAWLVRRNVRPMLRRAPHPSSACCSNAGALRSSSNMPAPSDLLSCAGAACTPRPPRLPMRLPHEMSPHAAVTELTHLLRQDSDLATLHLSQVQRLLESALLPDMPDGWIGERQHAMVAALECVLTNQVTSHVR